MTTIPFVLENSPHIFEWMQFEWILMNDVVKDREITNETYNHKNISLLCTISKDV